MASNKQVIATPVIPLNELQEGKMYKVSGWVTCPAPSWPIIQKRGVQQTAFGMVEDTCP